MCESPLHAYPAPAGAPGGPATARRHRAVMARRLSLLRRDESGGFVILGRFVGSEVTDDAATVMADCASSDSHLCRVAGRDLAATVEQIDRTITDLRLTQ